MSGSAAPPQAWKTHAALIVVQLAFASQAVEGKIAMSARDAGGEAIAPAALAMVRMGGAAAAFVLFTTLFRLRTKVTARDHLALAGLSVLGISLNQTLFLIGLRTTTPVSAALLSVTIPVFTAAMAVVARTERPSWRLAAGLGLALAGRAVAHGHSLGRSRRGRRVDQLALVLGLPRALATGSSCVSARGRW